MPSHKPESRLIRAAGAVAWRPGPDGEPEILLVHRHKYDDWSLPKGKIEPGEPLPVTAAREVLEEGGARLALGRRLVSVRYNVGGRPKRVHYWAARVTSTDDHAVPNDEVDRIEWVPVAHAAGRVSYTHDHEVLADFARFPAHTVPLILLRHAKAVGKSDWKHGDQSRPLDDAGRADAKSLADLLACFAPRAGVGARPRLISSPAARCLQTLRPFAELTGARVREEQSLSIDNQASGTGRGDSAAAIAALVREVIASGEPAVLCAHRENIPALQAAALAALTAPADRGHAAGPALDGDGQASRPWPKEWDDPLPTAGFWVLNLTLGPPSPSVPTAPPSPAPPSPRSSPPASALADRASARVTAAVSALRRWLRRGDRDQARGPGDREDDRVRRDDDATRPAPALISADRYDLSEP